MTTVQDIIFNGRITTDELPLTDKLVYVPSLSNDETRNVTSQKPRHGKDVLSNSYLPPPLVLLPYKTYLPGNQSTGKFGYYNSKASVLSGNFYIDRLWYVQKLLTDGRLDAFLDTEARTALTAFLADKTSKIDFDPLPTATFSPSKKFMKFESSLTQTINFTAEQTGTYIIFVDGIAGADDMGSPTVQSEITFEVGSTAKLIVIADADNFLTINNQANVVTLTRQSGNPGQNYTSSFSQSAHVETMNDATFDGTNYGPLTGNLTAVTTDMTLNGRYTFENDVQFIDQNLPSVSNIETIFTQILQDQYGITSTISTTSYDTAVKFDFDDISMHVVYQKTAGSVPNMFVHTEPDMLGNSLPNMMQTYRLSLDVAIPIGARGSQAGYYMTYVDGEIKPSSIQFSMPDVASFEVDTITVDKFATSSLFSSGDAGMDVNGVFRIVAEPSVTERQIVYLNVTNSSYATYRPVNSKEDIIIVNDRPQSRIVEKDVTVQPSMSGKMHLNYQRTTQSDQLLYIDQSLAKILISGQEKTIPVGDSIVVGGETYSYSLTGMTATVTKVGSPSETIELETVTPVQIRVVCIFADTFSTNPIQTSSNADTPFQYYTKIGDAVTYHKPSVLYVSPLTEVFDHRGLLAMSIPMIDLYNKLSSAGFSVSESKQCSFRTAKSENVVYVAGVFFEAQREIDQQFLETSVEASFALSDSIVVKKDDGSEKTVELADGNISVSEFPLTYNNIRYVLNLITVDGYGFEYQKTTVGSTRTVSLLTFSNPVFIQSSMENVTINYQIQNGITIASSIRLNTGATSGFLRMKTDLGNYYLLLEEAN